MFLNDSRRIQNCLFTFTINHFLFLNGRKKTENPLSGFATLKDMEMLFFVAFFNELRFFSVMIQIVIKL